MKQEHLSDRVFVFTDGAITFGQDAVALARFCGPSPADVACDLGTGSGVIPLLWAAENRLPARVVAIEREAEPMALAARSVAENGLSDRITVLRADWNDLPDSLNGQFTLISCNPPYFKRGNGKISDDPVRAAARTEDNDESLPRLCKTAARLLSPGGRFCFCMRPERHTDVVAALNETALELVHSTPLENERGAWLILYSAKRRNV